MDNRARQRVRRWTLITGVLVLLIGFGLPFFQRAVLPAAFGIGVAVLWYAIVLATAIVGIIGVVLGLLWPTGKIISASRALYLVVGGISVALLLYEVGSISWTAFIGPSAMIVLPDEFEGRFSVAIDDPLVPSFTTAGRAYVYEIPEDGRLRVDRGWIALRFRFEAGKNVPGGRYYVHIVRQSGKPLRYEEFECHWSSEEKGTGITCDIRPLGA